MRDPIFIRRIGLKNYKSIGHCDVRLGSLTFLVGPNGAGKSNLVDALRFVSESVQSTLGQALQDRSGINEVRRRSAGHPNHFAVNLDFQLADDGSSGSYGFRVGALPKGGYEVQSESCVVRNSQALDPRESRFERRLGRVDSTVAVPGEVASDRLFLPRASDSAEFRPLYDALCHMGFYNVNPEAVRVLQPPDTGELLKRDGRNLASVIGKMKAEKPTWLHRVEEYIAKIVPGVTSVAPKRVLNLETIEFRQTMGEAKDPWRFFAVNMSDGTLRALGILVALFQGLNGSSSRVPLIAIEEPEAALNPGASGVILDALREASTRAQVLVTSHSADLLDDDGVDDTLLRAVSCCDGNTRIGPIDEAGRSALRDRLYTAGELLRLGQLLPDTASGEESAATQLDLFDDGPSR